ncbi:DUF924 family protein [Thetidibacter halocola]|uniref:DUF924 domain-containing protein n=1 Tax=Thetidibacter halocola TaxID=2827239 RepID=A0A8J7WEZ5_9RHOB|nr:DUF924 family protein [Thetidibacter halocola]MBS0123954.1 DUF924 domain-containing protein [Thetidibacter halocola]
MVTPQDVLAFWLDEIGPEGWFRQDEALDKAIRDRFGDTWEGAMEGRHGLWLTYPSGVLAYVILMDQFPRNMFRGDPRAFASDAAARAAAKQAIHRGWDIKIDTPARIFFYLTLEHSEVLTDQDRAVRLIKERMGEDGTGYLLHARVHREIIRRFGRFPFRNAALSRTPTAAERAFDEEGGYAAILRGFEADETV